MLPRGTLHVQAEQTKKGTKVVLGEERRGGGVGVSLAHVAIRISLWGLPRRRFRTVARRSSRNGAKRRKLILWSYNPTSG